MKSLITTAKTAGILINVALLFGPSPILALVSLVICAACGWSMIRDMQREKVEMASHLAFLAESEQRLRSLRKELADYEANVACRIRRLAQ